MSKRKKPEDSEVSKEPRTATKALQAFFKVKTPSPVYAHFEKPYVGLNPKDVSEEGLYLNASGNQIMMCL